MVRGEVGRLVAETGEHEARRSVPRCLGGSNHLESIGKFVPVARISNYDEPDERESVDGSVVHTVN